MSFQRDFRILVVVGLIAWSHAWGLGLSRVRPARSIARSTCMFSSRSPDDEIDSIEKYREGIIPLSDEDREKFAMVRDNLELQLRAQAIKQGGGGEAGALVQLMTAAPVGEVLQSFFADASPMVTSAMRDAVTGVLGGLPREVDVSYETTSEKLGSLAGMLMMTGYLFRNAEYVVTLQQLLNIKSRSLEDYRELFNEIDEDGSGYIEVSEVEKLLSRFYDGEKPPAFEVAAFVRFFDRRRKGKISWSDFKKGFGMASTMPLSKKTAEASKQGPDPRAILKELGPPSNALPAADQGEEGENPVLPVSVEGTVAVELDGGNVVEVEAMVYLDALRAEAEALKQALRAAAEAEVQATTPGGQPGGQPLSSAPGSSGGVGAPPVAAGAAPNPLASFLNQLDQKQKSTLTDGIEPATVEAMRRLVNFMVGETNPSEADEFSVDRSTLASLCLWQLVTGYQLREAEATGKAKELRGR